MELYQIRHFVAVVETGSFTKGAQRAAVSQPAISASIARLEAELAVKLLNRRHTSVVPTAAGTRLFEAGKSILYECNSIKAELRAFAAPSVFKVGILQSLSSWEISKLLSSFRHANPHVAIELVDGSCEQLVSLLEEGQLDAILTILEGDFSKFSSRLLFKEPYALAVPVDHRFAQRQSIALADLHNEAFIARTGCEFYQDATEALIARGIKTRIVYRTDQDDRALALVAAGLGVAFIPGHFDAPSVKQVAVSDLGIVRTIGVLWAKEREEESEDFEQFIKFAETHGWAP